MFHFDWSIDNIEESLVVWVKKYRNINTLPLIVFWELWKTCNRMIFQDLSPCIKATVLKILGVVQEFSVRDKVKKLKFPVMPHLKENIVVAFFDGVGTNGLCGAGLLLKIKDFHCIRLWMKIGRGTNTQAELISLWGLLWFGKKRSIMELQILGDSKDIVDWINGFSSLHNLMLKQ